MKKLMNLISIVGILFLFSGCVFLDAPPPKFNENQFVTSEITAEYTITENHIKLSIGDYAFHKAIKKKIEISNYDIGILHKKIYFYIAIKEAAFVAKKNKYRFFNIRFNSNENIPVNSLNTFKSYCFSEKQSLGLYSPCFREYEYKSYRRDFDISFFNERQLDIPTFKTEDVILEMENDEFIKKYVDIFF